MVISRDEAVAALRDVEDAEARTRVARAYQIGSPYLILWGVAWMVGYTLSGLLNARQVGYMWMAVSVAGVIGSLVLARGRPRAASPTGIPWYVGFAAVWAFVFATYVVMPPRSAAQYEVFPALVVSLVYMLAGTWSRPRYFWIGAGVFCLSMLGFIFLRPVLPFWLAVVGGGGLILGGLWLRKP